MSTQTLELQKHFQQAVYERFIAPKATIPGLASIQRRTSAFAAWRASEGAISPGVEPELLRHWAVADAGAFAQLDQGDQEKAAQQMRLNGLLRPGYAETLAAVHPQIWRAITAGTDSVPGSGILERAARASQSGLPGEAEGRVPSDEHALADAEEYLAIGDFHLKAVAATVMRGRAVEDVNYALGLQGDQEVLLHVHDVFSNKNDAVNNSTLEHNSDERILQHIRGRREASGLANAEQVQADLADLRKLESHQAISDAAAVIQDKMADPAYAKSFAEQDLQASIAIRMLTAKVQPASPTNVEDDLKLAREAQTESGRQAAIELIAAKTGSAAYASTLEELDPEIARMAREANSRSDGHKEDRKALDAARMHQGRLATALGWTPDEAQRQARRDIDEHTALVASEGNESPTARSTGVSAYLHRADMLERLEANDHYSAALKAVSPALHQKVVDNEQGNLVVNVGARLAASDGPAERQNLYKELDDAKRATVKDMTPDELTAKVHADVSRWNEAPTESTRLNALYDMDKLARGWVPYGRAVPPVPAGDALRMYSADRSSNGAEIRRMAESGELRARVESDRERRYGSIPTKELRELLKAEQERAASNAVARGLQKQREDVEQRRAANNSVDQAQNGFGPGPDRDVDNIPVDPKEVISKLLESVSYKARADGSVLYLVDKRPAFVDHGQQILMEKGSSDDDQAVLAAILLAKEKYGSAFELTGSEQFKRKAIELLVKHQVDVALKNPAQEADLKKLKALAEQTTSGSVKHPVSSVNTTARIGLPVDATSSPSASSQVPVTTTAPLPSAALARDLVPIRAIDWWTVQHAAIQTWSRSPGEQAADEARLGAKPSDSQFFWFDQHGKQVDEPEDANEYLASTGRTNGFVPAAGGDLRERAAIGSSEQRDGSFTLNSKELPMSSSDQRSDQNQAPQPVLRGVRKLENGEYDTTVLLFKGKGDYLQGFVKVGDQKHQVIAHMNERKPDPETGEVKPNFIKLSKAVGEGDETKWKEIGFGNAVNRRSDGKPVYYDEVLFSVGQDLVNARVTRHVDESLHREMGFQEPRLQRPAKAGPEGPAAENAAPKAAAPAANQDEASGTSRKSASGSQPVDSPAADAPSAAKTPRSRTRAKAAA